MASPLDDDESERLAHVQRLVEGYREAARRALEFARLYREEEGAPGGERERACIVQANVWRQAARDVRAGRPAPAVPRPGLARARDGATPSSKSRAAG